LIFFEKRGKVKRESERLPIFLSGLGRIMGRATCSPDRFFRSNGNYFRTICRYFRANSGTVLLLSRYFDNKRTPDPLLLPSGIFMAAVKRLLSAPWKLLAIVRSFRRLARNLRRLARNLRRLARSFRRLARNLHAVAGAVLLRLFHHVVAQLLEWFSDSCSYIIVVICPFLPSPLAPATPRLGVGGVRGAGCFSVSLLLRAHSVASTTCAVLASGGVRRHMGSDTLQKNLQKTCKFHKKYLSLQRNIKHKCHV
jgi:AcrR family transcriptional regulator